MQIPTDTTMGEVMASMIRTLLVEAWASWNEELGQANDPAYTNTSQMDLMDLAPEGSEANQREAEEIAGRVINDYLKWWECTPGIFEDILETNGIDLADWGHYAVMTALGHGVAWADSHLPIQDTREEETGALTPPENIYVDSLIWDGPWPEEN